MKLLFSGGGTGGHFYPIIAVVQAINDIIAKEKILEAKIYFVSDNPYDKRVLFENGIIYKEISAGKVRRYFSILNFFDFIKTGIGIIRAIFTVYSIYPDVVFGKGGGASFPVLVAARILRIPVFIHESDSVPGRTNLWASKFAVRIAVSYQEASSYFPKEKTAYTGHPVRKDILSPLREGAYEYLKLNPNVPTILILGGSQGAMLINDTLLQSLPTLLLKYQIIHQTGINNLDTNEKLTSVILKDNPFRERYLAFGSLNDLSIRMATGISKLIISRAGSTIFEIAAWGLPSIIIPIADSNGDHQKKNAFNFARAGACTVVEENNLTPHLLVSEIEKIMSNREMYEAMSKNARSFYKPNAAKEIAEEIIKLALEHEPR